MKKIIIIVILLIIIGAVSTAFLRKDELTWVEIDKAKKRVIVKTVSAMGIVEAAKEVKVSSNISANIKELYVKDGDKVNKGDLLAILDKDNIESQVLRQKALLAQAKFNAETALARLKQAKLDYNKSKELAEKKLMSETEFERLEINLDIAKTNYEASLQSIKSAEANLAESNDQLNKTNIYAPISGTITSLNKEAGETVLGSMVSSDVILKIANLNQMQIKVEVDENDISQITLNDSVKIYIDAYKDKIFKGILSEIGNTAIRTGSSQDQSVSYYVTITMLEQEKGIKPGMTSNVDIITEVTKPILTIPVQALTRRKQADLEKEKDKTKKDETKALIWNDENEYTDVIFKIKRDKESLSVILTEVETGISNNRYIEITSGINEDEELVIGSYKVLSSVLNDKMKVKSN